MKNKQVVRRLFRFSLAGLFLLMTCVAGYLSGFRVGKENGEHERYLVSEISKHYQVGDLILAGHGNESKVDVVSAMEQLIDLISSEVEFVAWEVNQSGGSYTIESYPTKEDKDWESMDPFLSIFASGKVHDEVEALLSRLRGLSADIQVEEIVPRLQTAVATQNVIQAPVIRFYAKQSIFAEQRLPRQFQAAVDQVSRLWGNPSFNGTCTEENFPAWSSAQRIATWPKNGGFAYIQLQEILCNTEGMDDVYLGISYGWRPDEDSTKLIVEYQWSPTAQVSSYLKESNDEN